MSTVDLNELLEYAGELASQQLVGKKEMVALCVLVDATGEREVMGVETGSSRYENISQFAKLRQLMRDRGTVAYAWVSEVWAAPGQYAKPDFTRPSEHPNRQEFVMAVASDGFNSLGMQWDIRRDYKGTVVALVKSGDTLATCGPLANLLGERA
jgi:hypothetical protein